MEAPTSTVVAAYEAALPDDPRIERKKMFGMPCAFVNRQMFFGTFESTVVARIGPARVQERAGKDGLVVFTPMVDRAWKDYVQADGAANADLLKDLAAEALAWTAKLPAKAKPTRSEKKARKKA